MKFCSHLQEQLIIFLNVVISRPLCAEKTVAKLLYHEVTTIEFSYRQLYYGLMSFFSDILNLCSIAE